MKRIILNIIIIVISIITLSGCTEIKLTENNVKNDNESNNNLGYYDYYMIHSSYISDMYQNQDASIIIRSKKDLEEYANKYDHKIYYEEREEDGELKTRLDKYDEEFFKNKALALYYLELSSGSDRVTLQEPSVSGNNIKINYHIDYPEIGTCDMNGYVIVVEIDKNIKSFSI